MTIKSNTKDFILKSTIVHNNRYDYSESEYITNYIKLKIRCLIHGIFMQSPHSHLTGRGCPRCSNKYKLTTDDFISKANLVHSNKYDYSETIYNNSKASLNIKCPIHGIFRQLANNHIVGYGCPQCGGKITLTNDDYINRAVKTHNNIYDYAETIYVNSKTKVKVKCDIHGIFTQMPFNHLNGGGCPKCAGRNKTTEEFVIEANSIHENIYDYTLSKYLGNKIKLDIICPIHGIFFQIPHSHLVGSGCPKCNKSKGEITIGKILNKHNIKFIEQKRFDDCLGNKNKLPFDFYLSDDNCVIEYDGRQHFEVVRFNGCSEEVAKQCYESTIKNDKIKTQYCVDNKIKLIRIPFYVKDIENYIINKINDKYYE